MMKEEIEMNDLLGHSEVVEKEELEDDEEEGSMQMDPNESKRRIHSRTNVSRCQTILIFFLVIGTASFLVDRFYLKREQMDTAFWETDDEMEYYDPDTVEAASSARDCVNDPDFRVATTAEKNCDWVAQNDRDSPENNAENISDAQDESEGNNDEKNEGEPTIFAGVDDKDVYCEDLSRYKEWHEVRISKNDGIMFNVVEQMNHDQGAFTQGLTYARGTLFESAGKYGQSTVRILDSETANVQTKVSMNPGFFAEGLTYYKDTLVQITWKSQRGFIYNVETLEEMGTFLFETTVNQGWGITWDRCKDELIVTDGSENLHFWDPNTMKEIRRVSVSRMDGTTALEMNEIEFWRGRVLANIWFEDVILVIDPETGIVEKEYDFSTLWPKEERRTWGADVLNGISISADPDVLYFTGKLWNRMYKIQLLPEL